MTFSQLEVFVVIADLQGFSLAAQRLGVSQSAASHALKKLEQGLGIALIDRDSSPTRLTEAGQRLLPRAREILGLSETIRQEASDMQGLQLGSLRIGSFGPTSSQRLLPQILEAYRKSFPNIEIHVDEANDQQVVRWIEERRVDIGFVVLPDERFETTPLIEDQIVALVPRDSNLATKKILRLEDLCDDPFVLTEAGSAHQISQLFASAKLSPKIRFRTNQIISALAIIARGEGVALLAELALPAQLDSDLYAVRPLSPKPRRSVGLAVHNARQASPATQAFIKTAVRLQKTGKFK